MVKETRDHYYTIRDDTPEGHLDRIFSCMKWDELGGSIPVDTYKVSLKDETKNGCSCPAYAWNCKHRKMIWDLLDKGVTDFWNWRWDAKRGWQRLDDMKDLEEELDDDTD